MIIIMIIIIIIITIIIITIIIIIINIIIIIIIIWIWYFGNFLKKAVVVSMAGGCFTYNKWRGIHIFIIHHCFV